MEKCKLDYKNDGLLNYIHSSIKSEKIAAFDLDDTLLKFKTNLIVYSSFIRRIYRNYTS